MDWASSMGTRRNLNWVRNITTVIPYLDMESQIILLLIIMVSLGKSQKCCVSYLSNRGNRKLKSLKVKNIKIKNKKQDQFRWVSGIIGKCRIFVAGKKCIKLLQNSKIFSAYLKILEKLNWRDLKVCFKNWVTRIINVETFQQKI